MQSHPKMKIMNADGIQHAMQIQRAVTAHLKIRQLLLFALEKQRWSGYIHDIPANTKHLYNICTTSAQHWSNIVQMVYKCFVFAGICQRESLQRTLVLRDTLQPRKSLVDLAGGCWSPVVCTHRGRCLPADVKHGIHS